MGHVRVGKSDIFSLTGQFWVESYSRISISWQDTNTTCEYELSPPIAFGEKCKIWNQIISRRQVYLSTLKIINRPGASLLCKEDGENTGLLTLTFVQRQLLWISHFVVQSTKCKISNYLKVPIVFIHYTYYQ